YYVLSSFFIFAFLLFQFFLSPFFHSFPTRRSSDLIFSVRPLFPFGYGLSYTSFSIGFQGLEIGEKNIELTVSVKNTGECYSGREDRKSTRLNSSHVSISYAVFCLKKKKRHHSRRSM